MTDSIGSTTMRPDRTIVLRVLSFCSRRALFVAGDPTGLATICKKLEFRPLSFRLNIGHRPALPGDGARQPVDLWLCRSHQRGGRRLTRDFLEGVMAAGRCPVECGQQLRFASTALIADLPRCTLGTGFTCSALLKLWL